MKFSPIALSLIACGGAPHANPCATKGASYIEAFSEASGNCGAIPTEIININPDGTISVPSSVTCDAVTVTGCTVHKSNCRTTNNGIACTSTSDMTFDSDGSKGSGDATISCSGNGNGASCLSTYGVGIVRQ